MRMWKSGNQTTKKLRCQQLDLQVSPRLVPTCRLEGCSSWVTDQQIQWTFWPVVTSGITTRNHLSAMIWRYFLGNWIFDKCWDKIIQNILKIVDFELRKNIEMLWYYTSRNFGEKSPQYVSASPWNLRRASGNVCTRVHRISRTKRHAWRCHQSWTWSASRYCPGIRCTQVRCCKLGWVGNKRTIQERIVGNDKSTNTKVTRQGS